MMISAKKDMCRIMGSDNDQTEKNIFLRIIYLGEIPIDTLFIILPVECCVKAQTRENLVRTSLMT